ncbi:hypothetical protein FRX31_005420 [Thalictrum thalictroides]|uniref:Uncharacterized protein n=1 Tax=Thalictrum thalictroides TaxID=46969 RepID=A0A7J6X7X5_THATH|nr:hypothetical protein FRX31_005420 [Thalictrum thalictroides]
MNIAKLLELSGFGILPEPANLRSIGCYLSIQISIGTCSLTDENQLMMKAPNNAETAEASVRILRSLFPPFLLEIMNILQIQAILIAEIQSIQYM